MMRYVRFALLFAPIFALTSLHASWQMFSDGVDTYLYNTQSGDVYIRHKKGGKNFQDIFVKMPAGVVPSAQDKSPQTPQSPQQSKSSSEQKEQEQLLKQQQEALQKSQELLRNSINASSAIE